MNKSEPSLSSSTTSLTSSPLSNASPSSNVIFKKTKWSPEEDKLLIDSIAKNGTSNWTVVAAALSCRSGKQCRERWMNQLDPNLNKEDWKPVDDILLFTKHSCFGNSWVTIAKFFPGRSPNSIKNRWSWLTRHHYNPFHSVLGKSIDQNKIAEIISSSCQLTQFAQLNSEFLQSSPLTTFPTQVNNSIATNETNNSTITEDNANNNIPINNNAPIVNDCANGSTDENNNQNKMNNSSNSAFSYCNFHQNIDKTEFIKNYEVFSQKDDFDVKAELIARDVLTIDEDNTIDVEFSINDLPDPKMYFFNFNDQPMTDLLTFGDICSF
ncbi:hypothetical protein TRFO_06140 [Tritrichomonas foetus]|uniref:Myb-like DNA-binding domain containing protein n=1 Tax=Tritrichomonas foetus TaxID=1144522 RepID=A0A1J4K1Q5_9EUKA|nr:hypothetical protein TRFO_06140 [Tritrichomonas foetus]|eukprot:OHT04720.1 hypothetical protein TRFO_06140 [Tritrichomonas foetus]